MSHKPEDGPADPVEPIAQHLVDVTKKMTKAPAKGLPPNIANQFPGKGGGHFNGQVQNKGRNFRHQGR